MSPLVYHLWLGNKIKISFSLSVAMSISGLIIVWNMIYVYFLNGIGKISLQLISGIFGTIMTIPLTYYFATIFGINGILLASCVLGLINTFYTYLQYKKLVTQTAKGIWNK
jgi:O-antigen/teichoic acid export membrane protein